MSEYTDEIKQKLTYIRETFIQPNMRNSPYFGAVDTTAGASLPERLLRGYAAFTAVDGFGSSFGSITAANAAGLVHKREANAQAYVQATETTLDNYKELNLSSALTTAGTLGAELNDVVNVYSLCDDKNYNTYIGGANGASMSIADYMLPATGAKVATSTYTLDATTGKFVKSGDPTKTIDAPLAKITSVKSITTASIPLGRAEGGENSDTQVFTGVLPPGDSTDTVLSINPVFPTSTFESVTRRIPVPEPDASVASGAGATLSVRCYFRVPDGAATTDAAMYIVLGNQIVQIGTKITATAGSWTLFSATRTGIKPSDAPISLIIVNAHNKAAKTLLVTGFTAEYTTGGQATARAGGPFTNETDMFIVRRLLLLYQLMSNFYIALKIYDTLGMADANAKRIVTLCFGALNWMNRNMIRQGANADEASVPTISKKVSDNIKRYTQLGTDINDIDKVVSDGKGQLRNEVDRLHSTMAVENRSYKYAVATVIVFALLAAAVALVYLMPMDPTVRLGASAAALLMAAVYVLIARRMYDANVAEAEGFAGELVVDLASFDPNAVTKEAMISNMESAMRKEASDYLSNTIQLAILLQNMRAYGKINFSLEKELGYFQVSAQQLDTNTQKVKGTQKIVRMEQVKQRATMTLFMTALIVVCATAFAVVATRDRWPGLTMVILVIAGVILAAAVLFFIMDTSARVRTNGQQRYWGAPDTTEML